MTIYIHFASASSIILMIGVVWKMTLCNWNVVTPNISLCIISNIKLSSFSLF